MQPGTVVAERYVIEKVAGTGGMCSVFRARDRDGGPVALKALHYQGTSTVERFAHEVEILKRLRHPNIVRYLDSGITAEGQRFLVMEWLDGMDVAMRLQGQPMTRNEVLRLIDRVAHALAAAHAARIVHRDVKPANIFLPHGDVAAAKLIDFGVARWGASASALTATGMRLGTPAYMAPEQVRGERHIGPAADVFALGCVMYECFTGTPAFMAHHAMAVFCKILVDQAPQLRELMPSVPEAIDDLLARMLCKDPAGRPRDGAEVAAEVEALMASLPPEHDDDGEAKRPRTWPVAAQALALTAEEQRLVNVIVAAGAGAAALRDEASSMLDAPTLWLEAEQINTAAFPANDEMNAKFEVLADGSLVAVVETRGTATDQAVHAARYALSLRELFPSAPMALATGRAILGHQHVLGEVIDRACHLLSLAAPETGIRMDDVTARLIEARFDIAHDERGPVLQGVRAVAAERTLLGKPTPFVGRKRELATILATLEQCIDDHRACAILVTGPPGYGKSRLCTEFLTHMRERSKTVDAWLAYGDPIRSGSPLHMMAEAVRRVAGVLQGEPLATRQRKLEAWIRGQVASEDAPRLVEFLGQLIDTPAAGGDSVQLQAARLDPVLMGDQVRRAIEDLITERTKDRPLVLVLEDLHWGDHATVSLIDGLLRRLSERPLIVIGLARPELHHVFPGLWRAHDVTELRLGPLSRRAATELVRAVLDPSVASEQVAGLVERADGNAFYLEELVRNAAAGVWELPETVLAMVHARLDALEPEARRILRAASVFGGEFWRGGVVRLVREERLVDEWLDELVERELISVAERSRFPQEKAYRFRHDLVREGAYGMLVEQDRKLGHRLAGAWLEEAGESSALLLAEHFERGDDLARALPLYLRAAEEALRAGDFDAAIRLAGRGERCDATGEIAGALRRVQVDAHYWRGDYAAAEQACLDAMELLPRGSRAWYDVASQAVVVWGTFGQFERVAALAREAMERREPPESGPASGDDQAGRLALIARAASRLFLAGQVSPGKLLHDRIEAEVAEIGGLALMEPVVAAYIHRARASRGLVADGDPATFLREMECSAARFEEIGDTRHNCFQRANVGYAQLELGLYEDAERELRSALATAERMGLDTVAAGSRSNLALVLAYQGRVREAVAMEQRAIQDFETQGDKRQACASRTYLAIAYLCDGELERAEVEARAAIAQWHDPTQALAVLSRVLLRQGRTAEALERATEAVDMLERTGVVEEGESLIRLAHAEALDASGQREAARAAIQRAWQRLQERAARIGNEHWRRSFLDNVPDHARTAALAREWS